MNPVFYVLIGFIFGISISYLWNKVKEEQSSGELAK